MSESVISKCLPMYTIGDKIGEGIYGSVYRVFDDYKERAVKVVPISVERSLDCRTPEAMDSQVSRDFHAVKEYYELIKGGGVIEVYDFHLVDKTVTAQKAEASLVILMQLCPENLLDHAVDQYPLPPSAVLRFMRSIAEVLQRLSEKSSEVFLLTDLKPSNILIDDAGRPLIGDLGGIKRMGGISTSTDPQFTPNWSSPEFILQGARPTPASVIFAYGLVSYFLAEGRLPYEKENFVERIRRMKTEGIPFNRKKLPVGIRQLIASCLAHAPEDRPSSFAELVARLNDMSEDNRSMVAPLRDVTLRESGSSQDAVRSFISEVSGSLSREPRPPEPARSGDVWCEPITGMELVWVPGGAFDYGEPALAEQPVNSPQWLQTVDVPGFWMGATPVTQSQWKRIMGTNPSLFRKGENYPVENISWEDALDFIRRLADMSTNRFVLTLPTEVQWQYAATVGGQVDGYGVAADIDQFAWYDENSGMSPQPVGMKRSNAFGLYDMLGNVMEWCSENALEEIYRTGRRRTSVYADVGAKQPGRGGCWKSDQTDCFPAHQRLFTQRLGYSTLGMRLVRLNLSADMFTDGSRSRE